MNVMQPGSAHAVIYPFLKHVLGTVRTRHPTVIACALLRSRYPVLSDAVRLEDLHSLSAAASGTWEAATTGPGREARLFVSPDGDALLVADVVPGLHFAALVADSAHATRELRALVAGAASLVRAAIAGSALEAPTSAA